MRQKTKLQRAEASGKICGITDIRGNKYNGQIKAVGDVSVLIYDRNKKENVALTHEEIRWVRCG